MNTLIACLAAAFVCLASLTARAAAAPAMYGELSSYLEQRRGEIDQIDADRRAKLDGVAGYVKSEIAAGRTPRLVFVCTHNSRRSHMAMLWAAAAAEASGLKVLTYSGGTEATAFNPRAVAAIERAGFRVEKTADDTNPVYHVRMAQDGPALTCFSKAYDNPPNPREHFAAVMVCNDADEKCPNVLGSTGRFAIPFVDPKVSDNTKDEAQTYDERCAQIAREMLYVMQRAAR